MNCFTIGRPDQDRPGEAARYPDRMPDWATISSLATAGGTLVLAVATFASVRSANRAAHSAERRGATMDTEHQDERRDVQHQLYRHGHTYRQLQASISPPP